MTDPQLDYLGPIPKALTHDRKRAPWWRRLPLGLLLIVVLPTLIAAIYFLLIASPRYVSEAKFVVRSVNSGQVSPLGMVLQGVGLSPAQTDAFAVHDYIMSPVGLRDLRRRFDMRAVMGPRSADIFSRYPRPGEKLTDEGMRKAFRRFVTVGYDSTTGMSTLRVEAFRPEDAQAVNAALLVGGEQLINRLNDRAARSAITEAEANRDLAQTRLAEAQQQLTAFRNREQFIDPARTATEGAQLIGGLMATLAQLRAERAQLVAEAPQSPQLSALDGRIRAYQNQIAAERARLAGASDSLAPKISVYENLMMAREFADKELAQATTALVSAQQEARRQRLYLEQVVPPSLPDQAIAPRRWLAVLTVFLATLLAYGVGWLIWAGIREHRQH